MKKMREEEKDAEVEEDEGRGVRGKRRMWRRRGKTEMRRTGRG